MLNEKPNVRYRIGSARSGSSRVGSAHSSTGRVSSARPSSDSNRPKLHTGRPSSAPVVPRRPSSAPAQGGSPYSYLAKKGGFLTPNHHKSHDVSHLNLKVEGKSIRSVSYAPRRHQPVNRGSLRVVSSHGYSTSRKHKQFLSDYNLGSLGRSDIGSDSDRSSQIELGKTYTVPIPLQHPMICDRSSLEHRHSASTANDFSSTYTKASNELSSTYTKTTSNFSSTFTKEESKHIESKFASGHKLTCLQKADAAGYDNHLHRSLPQARDDGEEFSGTDADTRQFESIYASDKRSGPLSDTSFNIRPHGSQNKYGISSINSPSDTYHPHINIINNLRREADTTSNDGSECTVMSLGRKIQLMASSHTVEQVQTSELDTNWDAEWKQLLKQNHELLLKLSSHEEIQPQDNVECDHKRTILVHHTSAQTNGSGVLSDIHTIERVKMDVITDKSDSGICSEYKCDEETYSLPGTVVREEEQDESDSKSEVSECELEDIIEESSLSCKSTPKNDQKVNKDGSSPERPSPETTNTFLEKSASLNQEDKSLISKEVIDETKRQNFVPISKEIPLKVSSRTADFTCTTNLPTYRLGLATGFAMKSLFPYEKQTVKSKASKDLLQALQMIEDEENKTRENNEKASDFTVLDEMNSGNSSFYSQAVIMKDTETQGDKRSGTNSNTSHSDTPRGNNGKLQDSGGSNSARSSTELGATLPVLQVLVEKVFLFTQDLAERWQIGEVNEQREDLLSQLVRAEELLENICLKEGKKEDPVKSPYLHTKCEEKVRQKQEESETRIQKNLDLIRKLLDDKRTLTDQCELLQKNSRTSEKKHADKVKLMEERHNQELKSLKERISSTEQEKRERWTQQKTKSIKESAFRSLETKMKDLNAQHRDEISEQKAQHWKALKEVEEKFLSQLRNQEEELKKKFEEEKEEACRREREREQQRLAIEVRQCEQHSLSRMEMLQKQHEQDLKTLIEERHQNEDKLRCEHDAMVREIVKGKDLMIEQLEEKLRLLNRKHEEELSSVRHEDDKSRSEWRAQFMKEHNEARSQSEKELRDRLKRQRDKEIERAIKEIKQETNTREEEQQRAYESKIKNMRERYEMELNELETSEREARNRYLEMKSMLAQKEEEIVYLRARLHTQDIELCELQHMFQPPDD